MRLWADVYATDGTTRLGAGPVALLEASVTRALDEAGSVSFAFAAGDERARDLCVNERWVRVWVDEDGDGREVGRGIIRRMEMSGDVVRVEARGALDALTRRTVGRNRVYQAAAVGEMAAELADIAGWAVEAEDELGLQTARFSGTNVLKALIRMCEERGIHLREGEAFKSVAVGAFGAVADVVVTNTPVLAREVYAQGGLLLIERLTETATTEAVANRVRPLGAGEGEAALTLANSTRAGILSVSENGAVEYYLEDAESVAALGVIERYVTFKEIAPVANNVAAKTLAANALYDAAAAWLARNANEVRTYAISARKPTQRLRVGDRVRVVYSGQVWRDGQAVRTAEIDALMWVMGMTERIGEGGCTVELQVSTVDQRRADAAGRLVGALEAIEVQNVAVRTFPYWSENTWTDTIAYGVKQGYWKRAQFKIQFDEAVTDVVRVVARFKTRPLSTNSIVHTSMVGNYISGGIKWATEHTLAVREGDHHPKGVHVYINGVDMSAAYGGPWNPISTDNEALDVSMDLTDLIRSTGLYQEHSIEFRALVHGEGAPVTYYVPLSGDNIGSQSGNGERSSGVIELNLRVLGIAQAIAPGAL
jgi:hypothetical protein